MKKLLISLITGIAAAACISSCSGCSSDAGSECTDSIQMFVKADTAEVMALAEDYLRLVHDERYDEAISMLSVIENDSVWPVPEETRREIKIQQRTFPVLDYRMEYVTFVDEHTVRVTYIVEFFRKAPGETVQNTVRLTFAPQRINGTWYLELLDR